MRSKNKRNIALRDYFEDLGRKYPEYRYDVLIKKTAEAFFLSVKTTENIIKKGYLDSS
jgi:hypothetical protein